MGEQAGIPLLFLFLPPLALSVEGKMLCFEMGCRSVEVSAPLALVSSQLLQAPETGACFLRGSRRRVLAAFPPDAERSQALAALGESAASGSRVGHLHTGSGPAKPVLEDHQRHAGNAASARMLRLRGDLPICGGGFPGGRTGDASPGS